MSPRWRCWLSMTADELAKLPPIDSVIAPYRQLFLEL